MQAVASRYHVAGADGVRGDIAIVEHSHANKHAVDGPGHHVRGNVADCRYAHFTVRAEQPECGVVDGCFVAGRDWTLLGSTRSHSRRTLRPRCEPRIGVAKCQHEYYLDNERALQ